MKLLENVIILNGCSRLLHDDNYARSYFEEENMCMYLDPITETGNQWGNKNGMEHDQVNIGLAQEIFMKAIDDFHGVSWTPLETSMEVCWIHGINWTDSDLSDTDYHTVLFWTYLGHQQGYETVG